MYLEIVLQQAKANGWDELMFFNFPSQKRGCTLEEIINLEKAINQKLPIAYKEFLVFCGYGLGDFEVGSDIFYETDLVELQKDARDLLVENNFPRELPDDAFVFWMHGGYMFSFFRTSEGDNPPVHYYNEGLHKKDFVWNYQAHFTDFLITEMNDQARHIENARRIEDEIARDWTRG
jgi:hypothetical protein